jgi:hypothetical protein
VCVCERERERGIERVREIKRERESVCSHVISLVSRHCLVVVIKAARQGSYVGTTELWQSLGKY